MNCGRDRDPQNKARDMGLGPVGQTAIFHNNAFYFSEEFAFLYLKLRTGENVMSNCFFPETVKEASPKYENHNKAYFCNR